MKRLGLGAIMVVLAGCSSWSPVWRPSAALLDHADRQVAEGDYAGALKTYETLLDRDPGNRTARARRDVVAALMDARAETARLRAELAARDGEVGRLRQEVARLAAEADRLRADLEHLKQVDLRLERQRR